MRRMTIALMLLAIAVAGWARYQVAPSAPEPSLARLMPQGAMLFMEGKDLAGLLQEWTASPEKQSWLKSDNYEVFSRSRLFLRLQAAQQEFATAAGVLPNTKFLSEVAGKRTALGIYDIGKLEMLYITELPSSQAIESPIWQQRSKFDPRQSAGEQFFARTDAQSGRTVAFAVSGNYLILATREDLVAGALSAIKGAQVATLDHESWFVETIKAAKQPGDLHMVIHLDEVAKTPHFRTYWIQQNITAMHAYKAAATDLYRSAGEYREERVLLRKNAEDAAKGEGDAAQLAQLVPPEAGYFSSEAAPVVGDVIAVIEQKILTPRNGQAPPSQTAPSVSLGEGTTGSETSLEERIDVSPSARQETGNGNEEFKQMINANQPTVMLKVHGTELTSDGVFVRIGSTVVLSAANSWDENKVRSALQNIVAPRTTTSSLGAGWKNVGSGPRAHSELDGLLPISLAVRGKYLLISNDSGMMTAVLDRMQQRPTAVARAIYLAGLQHQKERQNFYRLAALVDLPNRNVGATERNPEFFSDDLASLSKTLAQNLASESIEIRRNEAIETQTVRYQWSR
jgi:hypothetical protein